MALYKFDFMLCLCLCYDKREMRHSVQDYSYVWCILFVNVSLASSPDFDLEVLKVEGFSVHHFVTTINILAYSLKIARSSAFWLRCILCLNFVKHGDLDLCPFDFDTSP